MKTNFSKTLERKGRWDTGLKFDRTDGSRLGFLINGLTTTCLKSVGTDPELRLALKKLHYKEHQASPMQIETEILR